MRILSGYYKPTYYDPLRDNALVVVLTQDGDWYIVRGYNGMTWKAHIDELEVLAIDDNDE